MNYEFIIFDMDGLIFDTEKMYYDSWFLVNEDYGFSFDMEKRKILSGQNDKNIHDYIAKEIGSYQKARDLRSRLKNYRNEFFMTYEDSLKKEGLDDLLAYIKENDLKACVASSNSRQRISFLLEKEGIGEYFDFIISGEEFEKSKPNPEIFLKAYEKSGFAKDKCLILEDSYNGYLAAKASKIDYRIIHDTSFERDFDAEYEADSLFDIIDLLKSK